jgi:hypothetical protein
MTTLRTTALALLLPALAMAGCSEEARMGDDEGMPVDTLDLTVADVGLQTPESVLHDAEADVYLVSNINGAPTAEDGNGFIAQIAADGALGALKWIDGQRDGVTLNAPKGMAIVGDTLYVTDITAVRAFHRVTGEPLGSWTVPGATFLNDLATDDAGNVYISDSGLNPDFSSSGTDAVYRLEDGELTTVTEGTGLGGPNGLAVTDGEVVIVTFGAPQVKTVPASGGEPTVLTELPGGQLDGVVILDDGSMLVSSWETRAVYHIPPLAEGEITPVVEGVPSPADIGWDSRRNKVLIPVFQENRVEIRHVAPGHEM